MKKQYIKPVAEQVKVKESYALLQADSKENNWAEGKGNLLDEPEDDGSSQRGSYNIWNGWDE